MSDMKVQEPEEDRLEREAFINLYLAAGRLTEEVETVCKAQGITMAHYTVLWVACLSEPKGGNGVPMGVITDGLMTRASDATRLVDRLRKAGYLERFPSSEDRRVVLVRATDRGRALFSQLTADIKKLHREQWRMLSRSELQDLLALLAKAFWREDMPSSKHPLEEMPPVMVANEP